MKKSKGFTMVELLVVTAVVISIALVGSSLIGSKVKQKSYNTGVDYNALHVTVPVVTKDTAGTTTITNTGSTGIPTNINLQ